MSRSHRYHPYGSITTAISDKKFKRQENRAKRRLISTLYDASKFDEEKEIVPPGEKLFGNPWAAPKDGKTRYYDEADLRKMIDATISTFMNNGVVKEHWAFCLGNTWHSVWLIEKLCVFAGIEKEWNDITVDEIVAIPREIIEKFIIKEAKESLKK